MQRGIVWVVDDDSSIRWVLERALAGAGLSCTTFESGKEVLDALASKTPDVLLSDIRMPGIIRNSSSRAMFRSTAQQPTSSAKRRQCRTSFALLAACPDRQSAY